MSTSLFVSHLLVPSRMVPETWAIAVGHGMGGARRLRKMSVVRSQAEAEFSEYLANVWAEMHIQ